MAFLNIKSKINFSVKTPSSVTKYVLFNRMYLNITSI